MRRGIAIVLALVFGWLVFLPTLSAAARPSLPQCCRKGGRHNCLLKMNQGSDSPAFSGIAEKCKSYPRSTVPSSFAHGMASGSAAVFAGLLNHPGVVPQTEACYRISHDRSRQKRGPPAFLLA